MVLPASMNINRRGEIAARETLFLAHPILKRRSLFALDPLRALGSPMTTGAETVEHEIAHARKYSLQTRNVVPECLQSRFELVPQPAAALRQEQIPGQPADRGAHDRAQHNHGAFVFHRSSHARTPRSRVSSRVPAKIYQMTVIAARSRQK